MRGLGSKSLFGSMFSSKAQVAAKATAQASQAAVLRAALAASHAHAFDAHAGARNAPATDAAASAASVPALSQFQADALRELFLTGGSSVSKSALGLRLGKKEFAALAKALTKKLALAALASGSGSAAASGLVVNPKEKDLAAWFAAADRSKRGSLSAEDWVHLGRLGAAQQRQQQPPLLLDGADSAAVAAAALVARSAAAWLLASLPHDPDSADPSKAAAALADAALSTQSFDGHAVDDWGDGGLPPGRAALFRALEPLPRRAGLKALVASGARARAPRVASLFTVDDRASAMLGLPTPEAAAVRAPLAPCALFLRSNCARAHTYAFAHTHFQ